MARYPALSREDSMLLRYIGLTRSDLSRRVILALPGVLTLGRPARAGRSPTASGRTGGNQESAPARDTLTLFLGGDVMTGRGIDQVLPHPSDPRLVERSMRLRPRLRPPRRAGERPDPAAGRPGLHLGRGARGTRPDPGPMRGSSTSRPA